MKKKDYNKDMMETSIGASILPVGINAVNSAGMGSLGTAVNTSILGGFALKTSKKFLGGTK